MAIQTYDPRDVFVVVDGVVITGLAEGTFVTARRLEPKFNVHVGAQGEVSRAVNANPTGEIVIRTKNTSPFNVFLKEKGKSRGTFSVQVIDRNTNGVLAGGNEGWLQEEPEWSYGAEIEVREWNFQIADYDVK